MLPSLPPELLFLLTSFLLFFLKAMRLSQCTPSTPCSKCLVPELAWIGDFILKYLNTCEITLGQDPSLNMKFIYICLLKVIYTLFLVCLHSHCNLSQESRCRVFISEALLALGKSWILDPHRFCSFRSGTANVMISSKCKSFRCGQLGSIDGAEALGFKSTENQTSHFPVCQKCLEV